MAWTDDNINTLTKLWRDGLSASTIAARIGGTTRNAVIGKVHRLGLTGRAANPRPRSSYVTQKKRRSIYDPAPKSPPSKRAAPTFIAEPLPPPVTTDVARVPFAMTTDQHCMWIVGDHRPAMCCGSARVPGAPAPYCEGHLMRAFRAPTVSTPGAPRERIADVSPVTLKELVNAT